MTSAEAMQGFADGAMPERRNAMKTLKPPDTPTGTDARRSYRVGLFGVTIE
ncbi:MAG: hypothetical protein QHG99_02490 [Methanomicrobiales archaeon]|nr:hypothetical protein [Methanomicrobiales archaeon]